MNDPQPSHASEGIKIGSFFPPEHCGASGGLLSLTTDEEGAADDWAFLRHTGVEYLSTWTTIDGFSYEAMVQHRRSLTKMLLTPDHRVKYCFHYLLRS